MRKQYFIVELPQQDRVIRLLVENASLRDQISDLTSRLSTLEQRFGYEVMLNSELIDLLNLHSIPFRDRLSFRDYPF